MNPIDFVVGVIGPGLLSSNIASLRLLCKFSVGVLLASVLLVGVFVTGGVGDGPWPPGCVPGIASQDLSAAFFDSVTFSPSSIRVATSFCFASVTVHGMCL